MFKDIYDWISEESKDTGRDDMTHRVAEIPAQALQM